MFNDSHFREGGTNLGCFSVGGWLTTPTSPPVYGPALSESLLERSGFWEICQTDMTIGQPIETCFIDIDLNECDYNKC